MYLGRPWAACIPSCTWAGPSLGSLRPALSVISSQPFLPVALANCLGGWPPPGSLEQHQPQGPGTSHLAPRLEARRRGYYRAVGPTKEGMSPTGAGLHMPGMFSIIKLF